MKVVVERVGQAYDRPPSSSDVSVVQDAALTVVTWMESSSWAEFSGLLRLSGVAEGDAARLITQTADHLNQISRLIETHPVLAATAEEGRNLLLRPPLTEALAVE